MPEKQISLLWRGPFFMNNSLAKINHNLCKHINHYEDVILQISPTKSNRSDSEDQELVDLMNYCEVDQENTQITINNHLPVNMKEPIGKYSIYLQPWNIQFISTYLELIRKGQVMEIWVYSKFTKELCVKAGIPEKKIKIIPLGVDKTIYHYHVMPLELEEASGFRFLFIVNPTEKDTLEALLKAYNQEFSIEDDVSLIIKQIDLDVANNDSDAYKRLFNYTLDPNSPNILFINQEMSEQEMAGLYKTCNCLVYLNNEAGFVLPVIEAMACGTPAIVPNVGPGRDYCDIETSFLLPIHADTLEQKELTSPDSSSWSNIEQSPLRKMLRYVYKNIDEVKKKGKKASERILAASTWKQSADVILNELKRSDQSIHISKREIKKEFYIQLLQGKQLFKVHRFQEALNTFLDILSEHPDFLEARYNTAIVYMNLNDNKEAIRHLLYITRSMETEPKDFQTTVWRLLGVCYAQFKLIPDTVEAFKKVISLNPLLPPSDFTFFKEILHNTSNTLFETYQSLGDLYFELGNDFQAEEMYMKALENGSDPVSTLDKLAQVYRRINDLKKNNILCYIEKSKSSVSPVKSINWLQLNSDPQTDPNELISEKRDQWEPYFNNGHQVLEIQWCFIKNMDIQNNELIYDGIVIIIRESSISPYQFLNMFRSCIKMVEPHGMIIIDIEGPNAHLIYLTILKVIEKVLSSMDWNLKESSDPNDNNLFYFVLQRTKLDILWQSPVFNSSGYADEQTNFLAALRPYPLKIKLYPLDPIPALDKYPAMIKSYLWSLQKQQIKSPLIHYQAAPANAFSFPAAPLSIGRTMFETDSLPLSWTHILNEMTEIWVPSEFNLETFANAGVKHTKIKVIPEPLDENIYNPHNVIHPYPLKESRSFKFLSVFDWSTRKGWEILLRAYFEEFKEDEDVSLILKVSKINEPNTNPYTKINELIKKLGLKKVPHFHIIQDILSQEDIVRLYAACNCFVLPSRGEGWGRPYMEAMAMELPTIGTRWSGQQAFMKEDNSFLINIEGLVPVDPNGMPPHFHGHCWAEPSIDHLKELMRYVYNHPAEAKQKGVEARRYLFPRFSRQTIGQQIYQQMIDLVQNYYK